MTGQQQVFSAHNLSKTYDMGEVKVHALQGVDLDIYAGELMVLLGASGSGKSTLLNIHSVQINGKFIDRLFLC